MRKILECAKVDRNYVVRGDTIEEVLQNAAEHAKTHGLREFTPDLIARVKANIRDV